MTVEQTEAALKEILGGGGSGPEGALQMMLTDFRKLVAVFYCLANGNESTCERYRPAPSGSCAFKMIERCLAEDF